ncbi:MAG: ABC transporter ATP-binding protein, partial [Mesorhizobium sp.]
AKALSHEPRVLFLDEPTAGVDVELRQDMWAMVRRLREDGVTIILTTHYIEEAEAMADRVGVINRGEIVLVDDKAELMRKLGRKRLMLELRSPLAAIPESFSRYALELSPNGDQLTYTYDNQSDRPGVASLIRDLEAAGIQFRDIDTENSSLEEIFVNLLRQEP